MTILNDHFNLCASWQFSSHFSIVITTPHDPFHHSAPRSLSTQCTMTPAITNLLGSSYQKAPWSLSPQRSLPISSQCSLSPLITMFHALLSQCSRILFIAMFLDSVITMLHGPCHDNAPEFLSSQFSMTAVITIIQDNFHYNASCP